MSQANIDIAKSCYAAFGRGDIATILAAMADDIEWTTPGDGIPTSGTRKGPAEVARFFEIVADTWNFTAFEPREYVASGDTVVAIGSYAAVALPTGRTAGSEWTMVWKFRDGKVAYFREYTDTEAMASAVKPAAQAAG
jgi:ketosteroid isomerase-like protein